jgi:AAHS family 4-hydroxybenzoate transporter-like MFS transporter
LTFVVATLSVAMIGQPGLSLPALYAIVFIAGWCIVGGQPGLNALASTYYPTYLRSTGVGASLGVGRIGAIVGPMIGGALVAAQWSPQELFWAAAVAPAISTAVIVTLWFVLGRTPKQAEAAEAPALAH